MTKNANFPVFTQLDTTQNQGVGGDEDQISQGGRTFTPGHNSTGTRTTLTTPSTGGKWYELSDITAEMYINLMEIIGDNACE